MVTVRFTLTAGELSSFYRRRQTRRLTTWAFVAFGCALIGFGLWVPDNVIITIGVMYTAGWAAYVWLVMGWSVWNRHPELRGEQVITFSDAGIAHQLINGSSTTDWTYWSKVSAVRGAYCVESARSGCCFVPIRVFASPDDEEQFRRIVERHINGRLLPEAPGLATS